MQQIAETQQRAENVSKDTQTTNVGKLFFQVLCLWGQKRETVRRVDREFDVHTVLRRRDSFSVTWRSSNTLVYQVSSPMPIFI
jgi:hypothetical protein